jgi:galactokinase
LGEHTDYNGGYVLPTAIPHSTHVALNPRHDQTVRVGSGQLNVTGSYVLGQERHSGLWLDYVQGVTRSLAQHGYEPRGFDAWIESDVPLGSGLSSSAALEVALLRALAIAHAWSIPATDLAKIAQWGENHVVGAPVGILDPMACHLTVEGRALFIDTRDLSYRSLELPSEAELVVVDSGIRHDHATGAYATRRAECAEAAQLLGVPELRDVTDTPEVVVTKLPATLARRVRHVLTENARVLSALDALAQNDPLRLGQLFRESHYSMRDDYQTSIPAIDALVERALAMPETFGARLTGGGFGGAIVCLVRKHTGGRVGQALAASGAHLLVPVVGGQE